MRAASTCVDVVDATNVDERLAGVMGVRRQQDLERGRLGGMFAASIVEKMAVKDVERRCAERDRKHHERTAERRKRVAAAAEAERKAQELHRQKAQAQAAKRQAEAEENAFRSWEKIERTNEAITQKREEEAKRRQAATEARRAASVEQLKMRRMAEEHRISEVTKRSELLEQHRTKVYSKQKAVQENTKEYQCLAVREKDVVRHMFHEYVRTGHLARPWGLDVLHGDALPSLIHITTEKSKGRAARGTDGPAQVASLLSVVPEKGRTKVRSHSSLD
jgi:hypothetical protein